MKTAYFVIGEIQVGRNLLLLKCFNTAAFSFEKKYKTGESSVLYSGSKSSANSNRNLLLNSKYEKEFPTYL